MGSNLSLEQLKSFPKKTEDKNFANLVKSVNLPVSPSDNSSHAAYALSRHVQQAHEYGFLPMDYSTRHSVCVHIDALLAEKNLSFDEMADYKEATLRCLRQQSCSPKYDVNDQNKVVPRNVTQDLRKRASTWYTNQFLEICGIQNTVSSNRLFDLEKELFCAKRSLQPKFKETDEICERYMQPFDSKNLWKELYLSCWQKEPSDVQKAKQFMNELLTGKRFLHAFPGNENS